jgi:hypothetical protein
MYFSYAKEQLPCQLMFGSPDPPNPPKTSIILFVGQIVPTNRSVPRCQFFLHSVKRDPCEEATKSASCMFSVACEYSVFGNSALGPRGQPWVAVKPSRSSLNLESTLRPISRLNSCSGPPAPTSFLRARCRRLRSGRDTFLQVP